MIHNGAGRVDLHSFVLRMIVNWTSSESLVPTRTVTVELLDSMPALLGRVE